MKIALINATSQVEKNKIVYKELKNICDKQLWHEKYRR